MLIRHLRSPALGKNCLVSRPIHPRHVSCTANRRACTSDPIFCSRRAHSYPIRKHQPVDPVELVHPGRCRESLGRGGSDQGCRLRSGRRACHDDTMRIVRHHAVGSGIIVDPDGYILTNAHVVEGAQRIRVILPPRPVDSQLELRTTARVQILDARLIGKNKDSDIALLKVEAKGLPYLQLRASVRVNQGELVFAIGSPEGLQDTVTMGMVSAVTRQVDPNDSMVYVQTDAAINPGNSGGPLIDVNGNIVGMNTMMLSHGGGSEGLGFAFRLPLSTSTMSIFASMGMSSASRSVSPRRILRRRLQQDWDWRKIGERSSLMCKRTDRRRMRASSQVTLFSPSTAGLFVACPTLSRPFTCIRPPMT